MNYEETEIFKAHEKIGFPRLDKETQFRIIVEHDFNPILDLVPHLKKEGFPQGLLKEYITVTKEELKNHLIEINYIQKQLDSYSRTYDGFWLRKVGDDYEFFERERGISYNHKILKNQDEVLDIYVIILGWPCKD